MSEQQQPTAAGASPTAADLEAGRTYFWCACGKSGNQPFCDGSHRGSSFTPKPFTADKAGRAWLCMCKRTKNPPYCDGSHKELA